MMNGDRKSDRRIVPGKPPNNAEAPAAALEDKIVQRALVEVLHAIYEVDFLGFSYGFRPGRSPHQSLDALMVGIMTRKVNWVLDAGRDRPIRSDVPNRMFPLATQWPRDKSDGAV